MKKEKIVSMIGLVVLICIIFAVGGMIYWMFREKRQDLDESNVKSSMLLVEGACKVIYEDSVMKKSTDILVGTKISDVGNNDSINKEIIEDFKGKNIIEEGDYEKYYVLTDEDLEKLGMYFKNEKESYYIIGYEKDEVIITKGFNGKYKLSDINSETLDLEDKSGEDSEDKSGEGSEENSGENSEEKPEEDSEKKDE